MQVRHDEHVGIRRQELRPVGERRLNALVRELRRQHDILPAGREPEPQPLVGREEQIVPGANVVGALAGR